MTAANDPVVTRRLAAIVIADVVGYTRLMERDDTGTFSRLRNIRDEVVDPAIVSHDGRIVKTAGDGLLAEFPSALAALRASLQIQTEMAKRNAGVTGDERIDYRIGINLGDIMIDGHDIAGDGVNVAARLEALAEPGDICVSGAVRDQVHGNLDVAFEDIGDQQVKNIARPIRVYRVSPATNTGRARIRTATTQPRLPRGWRGWTAGLAAITLGAGLWLLYQAWRPIVPPAPPAMSLAVLPFAAPSGSPGDEQLAAALTQDLTTALGQRSNTKVAANALVSGYKAGAADIRTLGHSLDVRYVVEGEVRRVADETIVTAHLIDTVTGAQVSSDRLRYASSQPAPGQPVPWVQLTRRLRSGLAAAERRRVVDHPESRRPMDLVLRGNAAEMNADAKKGVLEARALYDEALKQDPDLVPALAGLRGTYDWEMEETEAPDRQAILPLMDRLSSRMIALDRTSADAWFERTATLEWLGRWDEALVAADRITALDPADRSGRLQHAWILIQTGRPSEGLPYIEQALAVDPLAPSDPYHFMCKAMLYLGRYDEAIVACEKAAAEINGWINLVYLCAAYGQHGDVAKAATVRDALLKLQPGYTIAWYRSTYRASPPRFFELIDRHLAPGLSKAGIPEK